MPDAVMLLMILSGIISLIAYRAKSRAVMLIASIGWIITGLQLITSDPDYPVFTFVFFVAIAAGLFMLVGDRKWQ